mmetsp:Transcript_24431/g.49585  ORF Transcript_24431/g.49585 Transcript_24431/m.49585 type:complete len:155 (+) Transcript_24431:22-486(+)
MAAAQLRLKVSGAGHNIELTVAESETIGGVKTAVQSATGLHPSYQRLLIRGKAFDDDSISLSTAGIGDRTKLMLMHSQDYARDSAAAEAIATIAKELDSIGQGGTRGSLSPAVLEEMATQLSCRLDAIDVGESKILRELRRTQLRRCEQLCCKL